LITRQKGLLSNVKIPQFSGKYGWKVTMYFSGYWDHGGRKSGNFTFRTPIDGSLSPDQALTATLKAYWKQARYPREWRLSKVVITQLQ